jgi:hypothetical protein
MCIRCKNTTYLRSLTEIVNKFYSGKASGRMQEVLIKTNVGRTEEFASRG